MNSNDYISTYVKKYLFDQLDLPSSIMIDGKWGSGKTYYIKHVLIPFLERVSEKNIIYVTLNGVPNYTEFVKRIQAAMMKIKLDDDQKKIIGEVVSGIDSCLEDSKIKERIGLFGNIADLAKKIYTDSNLEKTIMILDDLERINMEIVEALGIINDFVEHKKAKCLVVANEKELIRKYNDYIGIKEKIISRTLYYEPDLNDFIEKLYDKTFLYKNKLKNNELIWNTISKEIIKQFDGNLRTILSSMSIMNEIYEIIKSSLSDNNTINEIVFRDVFSDVYRVEMWYKNGKKRSESKHKKENLAVYDFSEHKENKNYHYSFKFVHNVIYDGIFDIELIKESIQEYIEMISVKGEVSPLQKLKNWYELEDEENQKYYNELIESLENNSADIKAYQEILKMCILLDNIGYKNTKYESIEEIISLMKNNVSTKEYFDFKYNGMKSNLKDDDIPVVINILDEFSEISEAANLKRKLERLNIDLKNDDWSDRLNYMARTFKDDYQRLQGFLYLLDYELLLEKINHATNKELCLLRDSLYFIYTEDISEDIYPNDIELAKKLNKDILKLDGSGKINKKTMSYISNDMLHFFPNIENKQSKEE